MMKSKLEPQRRRSESDPLALALQPPANETDADREKRLHEELEAKRVSDGIDEMLRAEKKERKNKPEIKVLLLGQSESGKSTTLKQFQLMHSPAAFNADRTAWRAVIYLNLVKSILRILDAIAPEDPLEDDAEEAGEHAEPASIIITSRGRPQSALTVTRVPKYERYRAALAPLYELEVRLARLISSPDDDEPECNDDSRPHWTVGSPNAYGRNGRPLPNISIPDYHGSTSPLSPLSPSTTVAGQPSPGGSSSSSSRSRQAEVSVHHSKDWKKKWSLVSRITSPKSAHTNEIEGWWDDPKDPVHIMHSCAPAMMQLWDDASVRRCLKEKGLRLEESSGFFLNEIRRITALRYFPTTDDVLKARLKTTGVVEHSFIIPDTQRRQMIWRIYDVGGARYQRQTWTPYFDDVNAIIFLAPISAFDQVLAEDPKVNRLQDSLLLWKEVVSNKLLANVNIILFLNKCDLLKDKLAAGVQLASHLPGYRDRPNDYESIRQYFKAKFGNIHAQCSHNKERQINLLFTSVTDTRGTKVVINSVRDSIIKANLRSMQLM
ncbi:G-alpha-domain-containing protein [Coniophora puteana RWD-64-598 SS2]|uniref:G-alpha-domain-containing protein n=1 Tax=Coniophora puteana (strain RWD-64-598) TaxID=741705 RepID=A0A5M3N8Q8_CONPW|nr:G-alpha-domain-containing protein [Coniophora puteana RWD-64-598 SS2]EIW87241.1 G-alpha-domain-containing protein [Coniophora puteana RWD-64-598 SS2]